MFSGVAAAVALGELLGETRSAPPLDEHAAAGALIKEPFREPAALAIIASFWRYVALLSASRWMESVSLEANQADAPNRNRPVLEKPNK